MQHHKYNVGVNPRDFARHAIATHPPTHAKPHNAPHRTAQHPGGPTPPGRPRPPQPASHNPHHNPRPTNPHSPPFTQPQAVPIFRISAGTPQTSRRSSQTPLCEKRPFSNDFDPQTTTPDLHPIRTQRQSARFSSCVRAPNRGTRAIRIMCSRFSRTRPS